MARIDDLIEIFRGEAPSRSGLDFRANRGRYFTPNPKFARYIAQGGSQTIGNLIKDFKGTIKSMKIPKKVYENLGGNSLQVIIKDDALLGKAKTNLFQTMLAKAGSFTPLALKGLKILGSLPVATATMILQSTPANADEINMQLEDFAKLASKEKEGIETIDIGDM